MAHAPSDAALIEAHRRGDAGAFRVLVDRHMTATYRCAYAVVHDTAAAEDVTQETFVKAWRHCAAFDTRRPFRAWLLQIARNTAIDWIRTHREIPLAAFPESTHLLDASIHSRDTPAPLTILEQREAAQEVRNIVHRLTAGVRRILELHYRHGHTFREIATALRKPLHTVKSQHRRAIAQLRTKMTNPSTT
ncbi:sigma-70 family RNA polymerase sigma factor [Candidatus Uhrbacteria bacterium]|nr:sigma-70 family RNA polymerase sigma factor [Candidatus Uhrbacteria bacterium]